MTQPSAVGFSGFQFRGDADVTHRVVVRSNGEAYAVVPEQSSQCLGMATAYDSAPSASNKYQLFVKGGFALFGVKDVDVVTLPLETAPAIADVEVGTAFFDDDLVQGRTISYEGFSIWQML